MMQPGLARPPLSRRTIARFVQLAGLFDVVTALVPRPHSRMAEFAHYVPAAGVLSAHAATIVVGMLLVYLGAGLRRGKRRAWQVAVGLTALSIVLHLVKGLDFAAAGVAGVLLIMLLATQDRFTAVADPTSRWRALTALVGFTLAGFLLGFLEIAIRANHLLGTPGVIAWAEEAALGLVGIDGPVHFQYRLGADAVAYTTGACGLLAGGIALVILLRPAPRRPERDEASEERLRELLRRYGKADSLSYFALRTDKSLIWAPNRAAVVAYRVVNGVSLAAGDPIGPESAWPEAIGAWLGDANRHGWTPAVLGCGNAAGKAYRKWGLDVVELGDEAIVDTGTFSLTGRPMRGVRQAVNRMRRAGYQCRVVRQRDLTPAELADAVRAADLFRDGPVERGFSMALSRLGDPRDADCLLVLCTDAQGALRGLLQFVPWGADGLSLDLMRGDRTADNGLTELMVTEVLEQSPAMGVRRVSLNFAVLRSVFARAEELGAGPVLRLWHRLLMAASKLWQIESLYRSNAKYQPQWAPRYLCFPTARDLPRIAVAAMTAEAFLPEPRLPRLSRLRRAPEDEATARAAV
ncbi:phosphatidylglycerol lysyltransferase domain-containing protein [Actinoplanes sp. KI2]|uniref:phosphatidylglycerol lysyltransferase domain-containing protein n=1 Tax=Actinoplanes sp. KI2 TaxID=2983315 RepID=UPI0021D5ADB4|nr:phosphatidylglycerol lysyltransferase domain-containing protein [Actinoplanes sp. KI2]MCU7728642.1 phosphatidylglycerol lysyltransferase domain-containing protein [Actinoplanes sp. KI2]